MGRRSEEEGRPPRTFPMRGSVQDVLDERIQAANHTSGMYFVGCKMGKAWGERLTEKAVWHVVREYATKAGIYKLAPHDLRSYAESRIMPNRV
jgi:integrase